MSELHDTRELDIPVSELPYNEGKKRSGLGLPVLTKDMSESLELSVYGLPV